MINRIYIEKAVVSLLLAAVYFLVDRDSVVAEGTECLSYSFFHANIWHLLGNIVCIWAIKGRFRWVFDYLIAVFVFSLPSLTDLPVCGFSCVIFAEIGRRFGRILAPWRMVKCVWPAFAIGIFLPNIAVFPHLWALTGGFLVAMVLQHREQLKWEFLYLVLWLRKKVYGRI